MGAIADPNAKAEMDVALTYKNRERLTDPNEQKTRKIAVPLGRLVGVALTYRNGKRSAQYLRNSRFSYLKVKVYNGYYMLGLGG